MALYGGGARGRRETNASGKWGKQFSGARVASLGTGWEEMGLMGLVVKNVQEMVPSFIQKIFFLFNRGTQVSAPKHVSTK